MRRRNEAIRLCHAMQDVPPCPPSTHPHRLSIYRPRWPGTSMCLYGEPVESTTEDGRRAICYHGIMSHDE